jgi:hypothetical protein
MDSRQNRGRKVFRWDHQTVREWWLPGLMWHSTRNYFVPSISSRLRGVWRYEWWVTSRRFHLRVGVGSVPTQSELHDAA